MATSEKPTAVTPADHIPGPGQGQWASNHYSALSNDGKRYEIVNGVLYTVPTSLSGWHQIATGQMYFYLMLRIKYASIGKVYIAPFDVILSSNTVVQPDVLVVLNENRVEYTPEHTIRGVPDLIVEVLSRATENYDSHEKSDAYAAGGVKEYWLVHPKNRTIEVLLLENNKYNSIGTFSGEQVILSKVVPDFPVPVKQFFED